MKDRQPTRPGRVKITPENGEAYYATMEMADEPTEVGTPPTKAKLLTDATAALYGRDQNATVNNILADIGIYMQYWWKARGVEGHYEPVSGASETLYLTSGPGASDYTLSYSSDVEINQTDGSVSLVKPTVVSAFYSDDVSATVRGKYVTTSNEAGIYFVGLDAVFDSSYQREDGVSFYSATLTNCSQITSKYVESIGDYYYLRSNDRNAYPDSGVVDGIEYHFLGKPFNNAVFAPDIVTGSYTGDGTKTKTLNFDKEVVFLIVTGAWGGYSGTNDAYSMILNPDHGSYGDLVGSNSAASGNITKNGNSITWGPTGTSSTASMAGNVSGSTYHYIAFLR